MSSAYVYRLIKSSWGIRISITARVEQRVTMGGVRVSSGEELWLEFPDASMLTEVEKAEVVRGLRFASREIAEKSGFHAQVVVIEAISYVESDFQLEGLSVAMLRWAEDHFGLQVHEIGVAFDRESNSYIFEWPR
ncbi:hypothetical protein ABZ832_06845 [Streptantibioticus parmotrematis]|uniref:hypothetical protein n=1 Tax=Streptantibioticus parmotrematis TaxID=2873249 RepID=UPI0033C496E1